MKNTRLLTIKPLCLIVILFFLLQDVSGRFCNPDALNVCVDITTDSENISFSVEASADVGWVGVGIGDSMVGAYLMIVWPNSDGSVTISQRKATTHDLPNPTNQQADLSLSSSSGIQGNKFVATFTRPLHVQGSTVSASTKNFIYAVSDQKVPESRYDTSTLQQHLYRGYITLGNNTKLMTAHGIIMFLAWAVIAPTAVFIARFGRQKLPKSWFHLHWSMQTFLTIPLVIIAFVLAYIGRNKKFDSGVAHQLFGVIIIIALGIQWSIGIIHHKLFDPKRKYIPWWTKLHWWWGRIVITAALVNIPLGLHRYSSLFSKLPLGLFIAYYVYIAMVYLAFFVSTWRKPNYRGLPTADRH
ncbi:3013_t:CDS:2 [Paraglomus occultum]|uniref:3013_t:CDS:1 n=1 Tax=Paraglomus occultum TaxID=144539 RepID=A0A9N8VM23_9GLOM|nr:3013_t:CDS:2 [Paraglomus occultum]